MPEWRQTQPQSSNVREAYAPAQPGFDKSGREVAMVDCDPGAHEILDREGVP